MDEEDYVETSDPEERAELFQFPSARAITPSPWVGSETPRKRRKVDHVYNLGSPRTPSRKSLDSMLTRSALQSVLLADSVLPSSTPQATSLATSPTAAAGDLADASPFIQKINELYFGDILMNEDLETLSQGYKQMEPNERVRVDDILSDIGDGSQDELDVMSQATRTSTQRVRGSGTPTTGDPSTYFSPRKVPAPLQASQRSLLQDDKSAAMLNEASAALPLFLQPVQPNIVDQLDDRVLSPLSSLSSADDDGVLPRLSRFSSLPPSSPIRPTSLAETPQRARTHSPENSQRNFRHNDGVVDAETDIPQHLLEEGNATRRYSLRDRQPRQLNPYEYDKKMYKMQLRRIPEAMVRVVSPPRKAGDHGHRHKSREAEEDDFIAPDETEESQEQRLARRHHRNHSSHEAQIEERRRPELLKEFDLPDDNLPPLPPLKKLPEPEEHDNESPQKRRKKPFPLAADLRRQRSSATSDKEDGHAQKHVAIGYGRRKFVRPQTSDSALRSRSRSTDVQGSASRHSLTFERSKSSTERQDSQRSEGQAPQAEDDSYTDDGPDLFNLDDFTPQDDSSGAAHGQKAPSPTNISDSDVVRAAARYRIGTPEEQRKSNSDEDKGAVEDEGTDESESGEEEIDRRKLKALKRMMPAFMINKILGTQARPQPTHNPSRRSASVISPVQSSEDEGPLIPGKSKIVRRPGAAQAPLLIKGDSESSDEEHAEDTKDRAIINVSSSDSEDFGVESERSDDDQILIASDGDRMSEGLFDDDVSRSYNSSRTREDLIDRMLSRTRGSDTRKSAQRKHRRSRHARTGSEATAKLRESGLDVHIPSSQHLPHSRSRFGGRQTRLPFTSLPFGCDGDTLETYIGLTPKEHAASPALGEIQLDEYELERPKKLAKKQKREAALRKQLFTINAGRRKVIGNGRKKGFIQIDIEDEAFHAALAPVRSDKAEKPHRIFKKTAILKNQAFLKQTSLHDFPHHDDGVLIDTGRFDYRDDRAAQAEQPAWKDDVVTQGIAKLTVGFGISVIPSGVCFGPSTYLGRYQLLDLISFINGESESRIPLSHSAFEGISLSSDMTTSQLSEALEVANNTLFEWFTADASDENSTDSAVGRLKEYEVLMSSLSRTCVWVFTHSDEAGKEQLHVAVSDFSRRLKESIRDSVASPGYRSFRLDTRILSVLWFNVDFSSRWFVLCKRFNFGVTEECSDAVTLLMEYLLRFNLEKILETIQQAGNCIESETVEIRAAELWICLIHLLAVMTSLIDGPVPPDRVFWTFVQHALKELDSNGKPDLENSEFQWRLLFGLSALGHFTRNGIATTTGNMTASWETVAIALDSIKLVHSPADDKLPFSALRKRDHYVRMVVARCYLLGTRWQWSMHDAYVMFSKLVEIFKSRKFGNLLGEEPDFPAFLRYSNLHMLTELRKSDSAFGLFLKLVVLAAKCKVDESEPVQRVNARLRKLLSLTVPLSGVSFTNANPPLGQELSLLYNRFSSIIVAIYLEPTTSNIRNRLAQARRYVTFSEADWKSRQACIRALMYTSILVQHLNLPLDEPLAWLEDMVETLLHDYDNAESALKAPENKHAANSALESKNRVVLTIQLLLGCVRKVLETPTMEPDAPIVTRYPSLGLIDAAWIKKVFTKKDLTGTFTTRMEILKLLHSFLDARNKVIPPPRRPALTPLVEGENQESQDEYGSFDIDINDPDLIAALDNGGENHPVDENKMKDLKVAEIMDSCILPVVLRLMMQQVNDSSPACSETRLEEHWLDVDKWVDCWVGCAAIVVANERRSWSHYLNLGSQSWKIISDPSLRRRVGLRFMLGLLQRDPSSYKDQQESYHEVFLESMIAHKVTVEHEYVSLIFSIDGLRHVMLRGIPVHRQDEQSDFKMTKTQFLDQRLDILNGILQNLNASLAKFVPGEYQLQYLNNRWVDFTLSMLSVMKDILEHLQSDIERIIYQTFCLEVFEIIEKYPQLHLHPRLSAVIAWSATLGPNV